MARQLAFDLPSRPALGRGDFFVSSANADAEALVGDDALWPSGKLALAGPSGSGKTHLVHVWAAETGAQILPADDLTHADVPNHARAARVAVEDVDRIAGQERFEAALFHLHNLLLAQGGRLLLTGRAAPSGWGIALPDLRSRLEGTATVQLAPPDDALLSAVIVKLFADRQIAVPPNLVSYLVARIPRSFDAARDIVEALDRLALAEGRPVTRALAGRLLDNTGPGG